MLMQRAAAEYVHRLTAAANAEHAFARRVERFPQQTVGQIARGVVALDRWMRLLAEQLCGQVSASVSTEARTGSPPAASTARE